METKDLVKREQPQVVARNDELTDLQRLGGLLAGSGYFSDAREMAQAAVKVMAGRELGVPAIASMMGINVIKGKIAMGGNLIATRIRAHGYDYKITRHDTTGCVIEFLSKADKAGRRTTLGEASFTEEEAKTAEVFNAMYKKYPKNMYFNRAISNGAKWHTPEVFAGMPVYTPEELGAKVDSEGDVIHEVIDTGGHPVGTKEAAQAVAERKIEELKQETPASKPAEAGRPGGHGRGGEGSIATTAADGPLKPEVPPVAAPRPVPLMESMANRPPYAGKAIEKPKRGPNGNGTTASKDVQEIWKMMMPDGKLDFKCTCEVFAHLKASIDSAQGGDADYYRILGQYGMEHANDLKGKTYKQIKQAAAELWEHLQKCKRALAEPPPPPAEDAPGDDEAPPPSGYEATDDDIPENLGGKWKAKCAGSGDERLAEAKQEDLIPQGGA
jgi:hypothetical protein